MYRVACRLLVVAAGRTPGNATATPPDPATPAVTVIASDGTFAGFTLGAAILAVVVAGSYRYLRD